MLTQLPSSARLQLLPERPPCAMEANVFTPPALAFLEALLSAHQHEVAPLLAAREVRRQRLLDGEPLDFLPETQAIRDGTWQVGNIPHDLQDRRVELTGPVDPKMLINGLNSGAAAYMADFEDATAPTWAHVVEGQALLQQAVNGTLRHVQPETGKVYALQPPTATLLVRPRGWHLPEAHLLFEGQPVAAALVDFGLYCFHNAHALLSRGSGPYFYLPKLEHHSEAALWQRVFCTTQQLLGLPVGTLKATVLIETLPAAFQMHEILYALREHIVGLNCGRWDYIFSFIKTLRHEPHCVLPDRMQVTMRSPFLQAYTRLLIQTCHRRGAHAMGGMAAQIPQRDNPQANAAAFARVREDKLREVQEGHDGTWVAHPGLVALAREAFDALMPGPHQKTVLRHDVSVTAQDLLTPVTGQASLAGLRHNLRIGLQYLEAWLAGQGCVPLYHLMEDAATAEISRAQLWQWRRHQVQLDSGDVVDEALLLRCLAEEVSALEREGQRDERGTRAEALTLWQQLLVESELSSFLTLPAYAQLLRRGL